MVVSLSSFEEFVIIRKRMGITQQEAADLIGCSKRTVQEWEACRGKEWVCKLAVEKLIRIDKIKVPQ